MKFPGAWASTTGDSWAVPQCARDRSCACTCRVPPDSHHAVFYYSAASWHHIKNVITARKRKSVHISSIQRIEAMGCCLCHRVSYRLAHRPTTHGRISPSSTDASKMLTARGDAYRAFSYIRHFRKITADNAGAHSVIINSPTYTYTGTIKHRQRPRKSADDTLRQFARRRRAAFIFEDGASAGLLLNVAMTAHEKEASDNTGEYEIHGLGDGGGEQERSSVSFICTYTRAEVVANLRWSAGEYLVMGRRCSYDYVAWISRLASHVVRWDNNMLMSAFASYRYEALINHRATAYKIAVIIGVGELACNRRPRSRAPWSIDAGAIELSLRSRSYRRFDNINRLSTRQS